MSDGCKATKQKLRFNFYVTNAQCMLRPAVNAHNPSFSSLCNGEILSKALQYISRYQCSTLKKSQTPCYAVISLEYSQRSKQIDKSISYDRSDQRSEEARALHLSCAKCPSLAVFLVNSAPQRGQTDLEEVPDFSRWCLRRLLNVEN